MPYGSRAMKKLFGSALISISLIATVAAGEKSAKGVIPPPPPECEWVWIGGGSVGHLSDFDEWMYSLHLGKERRCPGSNCTDAFYLEVGLTSTDGSITEFTDDPINYDLDIIPITLNYKRECQLTDQLNWYIGVGAGICITEIEASNQNGSNSADETDFYAHIFAGIVHEVSDSFEIFGGARYIFTDTDFGSLGSQPFDLDGDVLFEFGGRFTF